jgi:hypothetical protein
MTNSSSSCHMGKMIAAVIIFAVGIQLFFGLMAIAIAAGNGFQPIMAFSHMLNWPVYFLSLALSVIFGMVCCLKRSCRQSQSCCSSSQECCTSSKACSTATQSCSPCDK